jgi:hypothetical protein
VHTWELAAYVQNYLRYKIKLHFWNMLPFLEILVPKILSLLFGHTVQYNMKLKYNTVNKYV